MFLPLKLASIAFFIMTVGLLSAIALHFLVNWIHVKILKYALGVDLKDITENLIREEEE